MPYRLTPRGEQRRACILAAARRLFERQGYRATTMRQVVAAAGTSTGNLYFYFLDKEALLRAVVDQAVGEIEQAIDAAVADRPPGPDSLALAVYAGVVAAVEQQALTRVWLIEAGLPDLRAAVMSRFVARARAYFERAPELLRGLDAEIAAHAWHGAIFSVVEAAAAGALPDDAATLGRFAARWNLQALGLRPKTIEQALAALGPADADQNLPT